MDGTRFPVQVETVWRSSATAALVFASFIVGGELQAQADEPIRVGEIAWVNPPADPGPGVAHHTFRSGSMDLEVGFSIYLPPGYETSDRRFPVVYWLHGRGGNESDARPAHVLHKAIEEGRVDPMVLVFANGGVASGYIDNPNTGVMGESVIVDDLIPHVEANFRVSTDAAGRGVAGFSMGGAGAVRLAIRNPLQWAAVVSIAGVLVGPAELMERNFIVDADLAQRHDLFATSIDAAPRLRRMDLRFVVGTADDWVGQNRRFAAHLGHQNLPIDYIEIPGVAHDLSEYLEEDGTQMFQFFSARLEVD
jgi:endo-1,4-beta-xylanase